MELDSVEVSIYFYIDRLSILFIRVVYLISGCVFIYSCEYINTDKNKIKFLFLLVLFVVSINLIVIRPNIFIIILGWDGLGLISYALVIYYNNESSRRAGIITVITNRLGDVGFIISIIIIIGFGLLNFRDVNIGDHFTLLLLLILILGAATKRAQLPFRSWLPAAIAAPTPVSSLVHSSTLVTAGVYVIIRLRNLYKFGYCSGLLICISVLTIFIAGIGALYEYDLKKIIALSTLSQLGLMIIILSLGKFELGIFHLVTHALFKAILFLTAGAVIHKLGGWQDIRKLNGLWNISPSLTIIILLGSIALFGFPFLRGFYSKDLVLEIIYFSNNRYIIITLIIIRTLIRVLYSLRLIYFLGLNRNYFFRISEERDIWALIPIFILGLFVVFAGCSLSWINFLTPIFINISIFVKILNLILIVLGGYLIFRIVCKSIEFNFFVNQKNIYLYFLGEIFFLKGISREFILKLSFFLKNYTISEVWIEEIEVLGIFEEIEVIGMRFLKTYILGISKYMLFILLFIYIVML